MRQSKMWHYDETGSYSFKNNLGISSCILMSINISLTLQWNFTSLWSSQSEQSRMGLVWNLRGSEIITVFRDSCISVCVCTCLEQPAGRLVGVLSGKAAAETASWCLTCRPLHAQTESLQDSKRRRWNDREMIGKIERIKSEDVW